MGLAWLSNHSDFCVSKKSSQKKVNLIFVKVKKENLIFKLDLEYKLLKQSEQVEIRDGKKKKMLENRL